MVDFIELSSYIMYMIERRLKSSILDALEDTPVVYLAGARQTGKSTLVKYLADTVIDARYITLDDNNMRNAAIDNPEGFIAGLQTLVIIDEAQRAGELFLAIKSDVDRNRQPGKYLLTGSANILLIPKLSESLAGRIEILTLWPLSYGEKNLCNETFVDTIMQSGIPDTKGVLLNEDDLLEYIVTGGYPEVINRKTARRKRAWFNNYVTTILQRDIKELSDIDGLINIPNILQFLAGRCASLLNYSDISRSLPLPQTSLKRYMSLLESTFLIYKIQPWCGNLNTRVIKSPKIYLNDTGLLTSLLGIDKEQLENNRTLLGHVFENFVVNEVAKQISWSSSYTRMFHFRAHNGNEVDLLLENEQGRLTAIEIKSSSSVNAKDIRGIRYLKDTIKEKFHRGIIIYTGNDSISFDRDIHAIPVGALWA